MISSASNEIWGTIGALSDDDLHRCLVVSDEMEIQFLWDIREKVFAARDYGREGLRSGASLVTARR
jgi:hypothetical protein